MIYLDSAATTLVKPKAVGRAVKKAINNYASVGRGGYGAAMKAADEVFKCRCLASELFAVKDPSNVILTMNATHGLNIAIKSLCSRGDRVVISGYEHNSVTRPLRAIGTRTSVIGRTLYRPDLCLAELDMEFRSGNVKAVIMNHVSNVFGYIQPVYEAGKLCKKFNVPYIVDASQSAGTLPVNMEEMEADFIAMPGHKGLYGPQGTGLLLCAHESKTLIEGGTGSMSQYREMPGFYPDRLEAGTHNVAGAAGLCEGLRFVLGKGVSSILKHERKLLSEVVGCLRESGAILYKSEDEELQTGVLSLIVPGRDCEEVSEMLGKRNVAVRAGLHCAPEAHRSAGTFKTGTVRLSFSAFNTSFEVAQACDILGGIIRS
jgi:selenocysteine lyase/cysteine desulfurase